MKKSLLIFTALLFIFSQAKATTHVVQVWNGYFQFLQPAAPFIVELGDTIQWVPLDTPTMVHTITSTDIPDDAMPFDYTWQAPADTFFQYVPTVPGEYDYVCTPHEEQYGMVGGFSVVDTITNLAEVPSDKAQIAVFPNPVSDQLSIDLSALDPGEWTVHLMDHAGRQLEIIFQGFIRSDHQTIVKSVQHLPSGVYYVLLETDGYRRTEPWVKR